MFSLEILLLALALAMDAAVVTFAFSLLHHDKPSDHKILNAVGVSAVFGVFQFAMLWLGSYSGFLFTFSQFGYFFQLGSALIFLALAGKCFVESLKFEEKKLEWGMLPVLVLAVATSIDAYAAGLSLGTIPRAVYAATEVGLITFGVCCFFYLMGQFMKSIPDKWLLRLSAVIFVFLGGQILWSYQHLIFRG